MNVTTKLKNRLTGEVRHVNFDADYLKNIIESDLDRVYDKLEEQVCNCQPVGETNVIECNCIDYIDDFEILEHSIKAV